jgi:hypothetical protein
VTVLLIFILLAARGEAGGYVSILRENTAYASRALAVRHYPPGIHGHLLVVREFTPRSAKYLALAIVGLLLGLAASVRAVRRRLLRSKLQS